MIFCTKNLVVLTLKRAKIIYASHLKHMISVWTLMHNSVNFLRSQLEQFSSNKLCWTGIARMRAKSSSDWATYCLRKALLRFEHYHLTLNTQKGRSHGDRERKDALTLYALTFKCDWQASQYKDNSSSVSLAVCCTFIQTHSLGNLWSTMSLETKFWGQRPFWGLSFDLDPQWYLTDEQKEIQRRLIELCRTTLRRNAVSFALN